MMWIVIIFLGSTFEISWALAAEANQNQPQVESSLPEAAQVPSAQSGHFIHARGLLKTYALALDAPGAAAEGVVTERLRVSLKWNCDGCALSSALTYDLVPRFGLQSTGVTQNIPSPQPTIYRAIDLNPSLVGASSSFSVGQNLDRGYVNWNFGSINVTAGRQAIAFGAARSVNPTDVFAPFFVTTLDKEFRVGVDALRVRFATGDLEEFELGVIAGRNFLLSESGGFLRYRRQTLGGEAVMSLMDFKTHGLIGLEYQHPVFGANAVVESAYVVPNALGGVSTSQVSSGSSSLGAQYDSYFRLTAGLEYVFSSGLDFYGEYHFNGAGAVDSLGFAALSTHPAYTQGGVYLLGRHYINLGFSYAWSALWTMIFDVRTDVMSPSSLVATIFSYSYSDESVIEVGAFTPVGSRTGGSEFGLYPYFLYSALKLYF